MAPLDRALVFPVGYLQRFDRSLLRKYFGDVWEVYVISQVM